MVERELQGATPIKLIIAHAYVLEILKILRDKIFCSMDRGQPTKTAKILTYKYFRAGVPEKCSGS